MTTRWILAVCLSVMPGCAAMFLQTDSYPERLRAGCHGEAACEELVAQARRRVATCEPNTIGYIRCADAKADLEAAEQLKARDERARERLAADAAQRKAEEDRKAAEQREAAARAKAADAAKRAAKEKAVRERDAAVALAAKARPIAGRCAATALPRAVRRRHEELVESSGAYLRDHCTPKHALVAMKVECKDANGFTRSCTKQVAGDVIGYECSKGTDPEIVKAGHYALGFTQAYPFPEDERIEVSDGDCERARMLIDRADALSARVTKMDQDEWEELR